MKSQQNAITGGVTPSQGALVFGRTLAGDAALSRLPRDSKCGLVADHQGWNPPPIAPFVTLVEAALGGEWEALKQLLREQLQFEVTTGQLSDWIQEKVHYNPSDVEWNDYFTKRITRVKRSTSRGTRRVVIKRLCAGCGKDLAGTHPSRVTCGSKCRVVAYRQGKSSIVGRRKCAWCGKTFQAKRKVQLCCGRVCQCAVLQRRAAVSRLRASGTPWSKIAAKYETTVAALKRLGVRKP